MPTNLRLTGKMERTVDATVEFREAQQEGQDGEWGFVIVGAMGRLTYGEHVAEVSLSWGGHLQIHPDDGPLMYEWQDVGGYESFTGTADEYQAAHDAAPSVFRHDEVIGWDEEQQSTMYRWSIFMPTVDRIGTRDEFITAGQDVETYYPQHKLPEWAKEFIGGQLTVNGVKSGTIRTGYVSRESEQPDGSWITRYQESIVMNLSEDHTDAIFESLPGIGAREWRNFERLRDNDRDMARRYEDWVRAGREGDPPVFLGKD